MSEKRSSNDWLVMYRVKVMDPDGWDRRDLTEALAEPITFEDFYQRVMKSTVLDMGSLGRSPLDDIPPEWREPSQGNPPDSGRPSDLDRERDEAEQNGSMDRGEGMP